MFSGSPLDEYRSNRGHSAGGPGGFSQSAVIHTFHRLYCYLLLAVRGGGEVEAFYPVKPPFSTAINELSTPGTYLLGFVG